MNFKQITSKSNPYFKKLVQMKKNNKASDEFFVEGARYITSAYAHSHLSPNAVLGCESAGEEAISLSEAVGSPLVLLPDSLFGEISETVHSQGILAVYPRKSLQTKVEELSTGNSSTRPCAAAFEGGCSADASCEERNMRGRKFSGGRDSGSHRDKKVEKVYLVLDEVQDPGNVGAMIRTADAAGISDIILVKGTADPYSPKASRASAGSVLNVRTYFGTREEILRFLIARGCDIVVTVIDGVNYKNYTPSGSTALILGNEARGVHLEFVKNAGHRIGIPMRGGAESLNVAVAAGILIYHLRG